MAKLTNEKHERFCQEYLIDLNGKQAAIRTGYSEATAAAQASRLLTNVNIQERVAELQAERSKRTTIDADWLLARLAEEANANVQDLYDDEGKLKPVKEWPEIWCKGLVAGLDTERTMVEGKAGKGDELTTVHKIKLSDRLKRLELIGKHISVGAFEEKTKNLTEFVIVTRDYSKEKPFDAGAKDE